MEFTQAQGAVLSRMDERSFRALVDDQCLLPTGDTAEGGRGKPKLFDKREIMIASILTHLNLPSAGWRKPIANWIRRSPLQIDDVLASPNPIYLIVEFLEGSATLRISPSVFVTSAFSKGQKELVISVSLIENEKQSRVLGSFIGANIQEAIWWAKILPDDLKRLLPKQSANLPADPLVELEEIFSSLNNRGK